MWNNICVEELTRRCSDFPVCQTMNGAALVDDRSGVMFDVELCIPWDAPEAVVDINSAEVVTLGRSFHDVTIVDMGDEREPMVTLADMTRLREL